MLKKILLLVIAVFITSNVFSQRKFDRWWNEVEELELQGKSMSAFEVVKKIKRKADRKENPQQFLKAFLYVSKFKLILKDNSQEEVYQDYLDEIDRQSFPIKNILSSYLAESLNQYYTSNRNKINKRTVVYSFTTSFKTWGKEQFKQKIFYYYKESLSKEKQLIDTSLEDYTAILNYEDNYKHYNSSLYDLLAKRYIDFLKNTSSFNTSKSSYSIKDTAFFSLPNEFLTLNVSSVKGSSNKAEILKMYQKLTEHHVNNNDSLSVLQTSFERLHYVKEKGEFNNANILYEKALKNLANTYKSDGLKSWINYKLALFYYSNPHKKERPNYYNKSLSYIEKNKKIGLNNFPTVKTLQIEKAIMSSEVSIKVNQYILPNRKFRALINFRNTDSLYLSVYKLQHSISDNQRTKLDAVVKKAISEKKAYSSQKFKLPKVETLFSYTTEILIDSLPVGKYILLFSKHKDINPDTFSYQYQQVQATNIFYTGFEFDDKQQLYITDITTGKPIENVQVLLEENPLEKYYSNAKGLVTLKAKDEFYYSNITLIKNQDSLKGDVRLDEKRNENHNQQPKINSRLFIDRAIYRPGQTLYFKGIISYQSKTERKVVANERVVIELFDVNDNVVDTLSLVTNEFGSVHGEFKIPKNVLTGNFEISINEDFEENSTYQNIDFNDSYQYITVEEYKRPKFEAEFKPIDSAYVLNDSVQLKGKAISFFGGHVTGAKVSYTIDRKLNYKSSFYQTYPNINFSKERIIEGETNTDNKGNFIINFKAKPNSLIDSKFKPVFYYSIEATITDINGETHTAYQTVNLGHHTTELHLKLPISQSPSEIEYGKDVKITIEAKDLNNLPSKAKGAFYIYKYQNPQRVLTRRLWDLPDIQHIPKKEYVTHFPFTVYDSLELKENWPKKLIKTISSEIDSVKVFDLEKYEDEFLSGEYYVEFKGKGKLGFPVEVSRNVKIINPKHTTVLREKEFIAFSYQFTKQKNEVDLKFYTPLDTLPIFINMAYKGDLQKQENLVLVKGDNTFTYKIPEDTKFVSLKYMFNKHGSYQSHNRNIPVPQPQKKKAKIYNLRL